MREVNDHHILGRDEHERDAGRNGYVQASAAEEGPGGEVRKPPCAEGEKGKR